jgi:hypothetical protein
MTEYIREVILYASLRSHLGAMTELRKATITFVMSVCLSLCRSAWNDLALTGYIFVKFNSLLFFENLSINVKCYWSLTRILGAFCDDLFAFMIDSLWFLLRMRKVSDKSCSQNKKTPFQFNGFLSRKAYCFWDNVEKYSRSRQAIDDNIIRRMRIACWIPKATDTLRIHNTYCFFTATVVTWTRLNSTL